MLRDVLDRYIQAGADIRQTFAVLPTSPSVDLGPHRLLSIQKFNHQLQKLFRLLRVYYQTFSPSAPPIKKRKAR